MLLVLRTLPGRGVMARPHPRCPQMYFLPLHSCLQPENVPHFRDLMRWKSWKADPLLITAAEAPSQSALTRGLQGAGARASQGKPSQTGRGGTGTNRPPNHVTAVLAHLASMTVCSRITFDVIPGQTQPPVWGASGYPQGDHMAAWKEQSFRALSSEGPDLRGCELTC